MTSDAFADLEPLAMVTCDDGGMSSYDSTKCSVLAPSGVGCGSNSILERSRGILARGGAATTTAASAKRSVDPDASAFVSDDDADDDDDVAIRRPWKGRWKNDRRYYYATSDTARDDRGPTTTPRAVSPRWESDGSNYDPDSDWDADDAEVDSVPHDEDAFVARPRRSK